MYAYMYVFKILFTPLLTTEYVNENSKICKIYAPLFKRNEYTLDHFKAKLN